MDPKRLKVERERGVQILKGVQKMLKEDYYDLTFHGMDLDARVKQAEAKMATAESLGQIFGIVAQLVNELDDSHTFFFPPGRPVDVEYGWRMQIIGEDCFVVAVKPKSDAEAQGLRPGDRVVSIDGFKPNRKTMQLIEYNYNALRPQPGMRAIFQSPGGQPRELALKAEVVKLDQQVNPTQLYYSYLNNEEDDKKLPVYKELADDVFIWKLRDFGLTEGKVDDLMKRASKHKSMVIDMRGNPGGYVDTMVRLTSYFIDNEYIAGMIQKRKKPEAIKVKPRSKPFKGKVVLLIDSESASAAESFPYLMQLQKRGTIIGDRSAGAVMVATFQLAYITSISSDNIVPFYMNMTIGQLIFPDGKSLEHVGVTPDEIVLPTPEDLAAGRDTVLAHAVEVAGGKISSQEAGTLFPYVWRRVGQ
ncbi:MAG: S41 family peptidase [Pyrinomonadaceae bacterium]